MPRTEDGATNDRRRDLRDTRVRLWSAAGLIATAALVAFALPRLPRGTDIYVHVLWPWQVMRAAAAASLPVWLPDLNAGFGSPGIRLYSPLGPVVAGTLGLLLGTAARGIRAALVLAAGATLAWWAPEPRTRRWSVALVALASPAMLTELVGRFPLSELLAVPLAWRLMEDGLRDRWSWLRIAPMTAALWLMHAPTAMMTGLILLAIAVTGRFRWRALHGLAAGGATGAALTAWHWLPLISTMWRWRTSVELVEAELSPPANLLGLPSAHLMWINLAMGWAAVGLATALLVSEGWRRRRGAIALALIVLSAWPFEPLWRAATPLGWIQFPWRLLIPATFLGATGVFEATAGRRGRRAASVALVLTPWLLLPRLELARDPGLTAAMGWRTAGPRVAESVSGNPLLVDADQNRPPWWDAFARTLHDMGPRPARLDTDGTVRPIAVRPLLHSFDVHTSEPALLTVRLLFTDGWTGTVDGEPGTISRNGAAVAVRVPAGRHTVTVRWAGDPLSRVGLALAAVAALCMALAVRRGRRPSRPATTPMLE